MRERRICTNDESEQPVMSHFSRLARFKLCRHTVSAGVNNHINS